MNKENASKIWNLIQETGDFLKGKLPDHPNHPKGRNPYAHVALEVKNHFGMTYKDIPDEKFNTMYTVEYLGNVVEGQIIKYLNVDIKELKKSAMDSIKNNEAVWFGCDVGKRFSRDMGVLDMGIYDYENVFQTSFKMNKQTRLEYGDSEMTHAMLLTGVDIKKRNSTKWKIENSWGTKSGNQGYMLSLIHI